MIWFALALVGLSAGLIAGLLGIGGGILLVPAFMELFGLWFPQGAVEQTAIGTSHTVIAVASLMAVMTHKSHSKIDFRMVLRLLAGALVGISIGTFCATKADGVTIRLLLAVVLCTVAYRTVTRARKHALEPPPPSPDWTHSVAGVGIGTFSSFFGVGGGILLVPFLSRFGGKRTLDAMATSSTFIMFSASISALLFMFFGVADGNTAPMSVGYVHLGGVAVGGGAAIIGAKIGVKTSRKISAERLLHFFSLLLLLVAARLVYRALLS
jgi:uncharacterized membrane protein YfcA